MKNSRQALGKWGEDLAAGYLSERGYTILGRNIRTAYGELDLVAHQEVEEGPVVVFVEVKTRRSKKFGYPEDAITARKREHLLSSAQAYLQEHPELDKDWRVDVIAIQKFSPDHPPMIRHFENALTEL
jgi:putative endonuclease